MDFIRILMILLGTHVAIFELHCEVLMYGTSHSHQDGYHAVYFPSFVF